jgi:hypothetical protein
MSVIYSSSFLLTSGILKEGLPKLNRIHRQLRGVKLGMVFANIPSRQFTQH